MLKILLIAGWDTSTFFFCKLKMPRSDEKERVKFSGPKCGQKIMKFAEVATCLVEALCRSLCKEDCAKISHRAPCRKIWCKTGHG